VNEYGFIETPYSPVYRELPLDDEQLIGQITREESPLRAAGIDPGRDVIDEAVLKSCGSSSRARADRAVRQHENRYLSADEEDRYLIAQANAPLDEFHRFATDRVSARHHQRFLVSPIERIDYMDVAPRQIVGISAALIPFLEHDDANRALMGSNMQRQAVPLLKPDIPIVSTGVEHQAAKDSGQVLLAAEDGEVLSVTGDQIVVRGESGIRTYRLRKYNRSNQSTCIDQRPVVQKGR